MQRAAERALREIEGFSPAARLGQRSAMATPTFCVKFTNDTMITIAVDVAAVDAAGAIVDATAQLLEVLLEAKAFRPVEVYPVEIR